jgi:hypothetical protein
LPFSRAGLHGLLDHRQQLASQGLEVDLLAQPGAERLVVAAPVEAAVHRLLDAAAGRLEHRSHGQGRPGYDQAGTLGAAAGPSPSTTPAYPRPSSSVSSP